MTLCNISWLFIQVLWVIWLAIGNWQLAKRLINFINYFVRVIGAYPEYYMLHITCYTSHTWLIYSLSFSFSFPFIRYLYWLALTGTDWHRLALLVPTAPFSFACCRSLVEITSNSIPSFSFLFLFSLYLLYSYLYLYLYLYFFPLASIYSLLASVQSNPTLFNNFLFF